MTTTAEKVRVPLAQAEPLAQEALALLAPACRRLEIAGSVRRRRPDVADVELVAVPRTEPVVDLFGEPRGERDLLEARCVQLRAEGVFVYRLSADGKHADGEKHKRFVFHGQAGTVPLDLFVVTPPAQWGAIFTIRTGPAEYAHRLVSPSFYGGGMPPGMAQARGALWNGEQLVETPEEADYFRALGLVWLPPEQRTDSAPLTRLRGRARR